VVAAISQSEAVLSAPDFPLARVRQRLPLSPMRRTIAERLKKSVAAAVSLTLTREVHADTLVTARKRLAEMIGDTPSFDALFVKLLAVALREHPELNVALEDETLVYFEDVHVGFAVALSDGVVVPVIRHADSGSLRGIHSSIVDLSTRAREGKLRDEDIQGGTATLTNLGDYGIDAFTPVLNPPQAAILGIGRIVQRAWIDRGLLVPAQTCVLSLTFDHRVADGVPAAQLLDAIAKRMNDADYLASLAA
jgi:pyruvate dehydrogenase E2 component (dihydrolipoamide acetyltransferase)